jgi:ribonuclease P protein component
MEFGFPKSKRLLKTKEFRTVFDGGIKNVSRHLVLFGMPSQTDRVGLVVSKKVGNAVARNRVKRIIRENFRLEIPGSPLPMDVVVVARHTAKDASFEELAKSLSKGISKLKKALSEKSENVSEDAKKIASSALDKENHG